MKKKINKINTSLTRNIINGTLNATAWTFQALFFAGSLTIDVFLKPSLYADLSPVAQAGFENHIKESAKKNFKEMTIRHSLWRLERQGFVHKNGTFYKLTKKGRKLANYINSIRNVTDENKWDRKYRVVVFDIPEKNKDFRNWFRQELMILQYKKLQKSVFISKYPLTRDLVKEIKKRKMGNYVNYLLVDRVYKNIL